MNKFDIQFFEKYIPEWQQMIDVIHTHPIIILSRVITQMTLFVFIPSFFYYFSETIQSLVPFIFLESFLLIIFIKIIYDIFNWYNDVWIVTTWWVIWLERSFLKSNTESIDFDNIEWIWVEQEWVWDKFLRKWDIVIHKVWDDSFVLEEAINPYDAVNLIEVTSQHSWDDLENNFHDERFDVIMDALWWVVETYLEKEWEKSKEETQKENTISKYERKDDTIDLR